MDEQFWKEVRAKQGPFTPEDLLKMLEHAPKSSKEITEGMARWFRDNPGGLERLLNDPVEQAR